MKVRIVQAVSLRSPAQIDAKFVTWKKFVESKKYIESPLGEAHVLKGHESGSQTGRSVPGNDRVLVKIAPSHMPATRAAGPAGVGVSKPTPRVCRRPELRVRPAVAETEGQG